MRGPPHERVSRDWLSAGASSCCKQPRHISKSNVSAWRWCNLSKLFCVCVCGSRASWILRVMCATYMCILSWRDPWKGDRLCIIALIIRCIQIQLRQGLSISSDPITCKISHPILVNSITPIFVPPPPPPQKLEMYSSMYYIHTEALKAAQWIWGSWKARRRMAIQMMVHKKWEGVDVTEPKTASSKSKVGVAKTTKPSVLQENKVYF